MLLFIDEPTMVVPELRLQHLHRHNKYEIMSKKDVNRTKNLLTSNAKHLLNDSHQFLLSRQLPAPFWI